MNKDNQDIKTIRFSHRYNKFNGLDIEKPVRLVHVEQIDLQNLSSYFIDYDTTYYENGVRKQFPIMANRCIMLYFMTVDGHLFTTIRDIHPGSIATTWDA